MTLAVTRITKHINHFVKFVKSTKLLIRTLCFFIGMIMSFVLSLMPNSRWKPEEFLDSFYYFSTGIMFCILMLYIWIEITFKDYENVEDARIMSCIITTIFGSILWPILNYLV